MKSKLLSAITSQWVSWWKQQSPSRQDRFALLAPIAAVGIFLLTIVSSVGYLRIEEMEREQESVQRDLEYAQQKLRLHLLEQQEQMLRLARDLSNDKFTVIEFAREAMDLANQYPEVTSISWIDPLRRVRSHYASSAADLQAFSKQDKWLLYPQTEDSFLLSREIRRSIYSTPILIKSEDGSSLQEAHIQLHIPMFNKDNFKGVVLVEYSLDNLLRYAVPAEVTARHAVSLVDANNILLAGQSIKPRSGLFDYAPLEAKAYEYSVPVSTVGNSLQLRAQAYRTSQVLIGSGLFWLVLLLSGMTTWMLIGTWRHTRRRLHAQQALVAETNFRRAMENSILTGMRAMDMNGRITYVNAAFCQMTGWNDKELVGLRSPFPYWPEEDRHLLNAKLEDQLNGRTTLSGFQIRVKRKNGTLFDARLYVSPLIDAHGQQTGWMSSMTDITEPNRIREQLSASYERFTTVLEALDASVSVTPLGSTELLFANKLYRQWFGNQSEGHMNLVAQAGMSSLNASTNDETMDDFSGMPGVTLTQAKSENSEIYLPNLNKWLEVRSRYLNWVDGRLAQMVISTDITSRRHAEEQAALQAERAQSASRLITMGEMASSVAHELNQPLTAISNYCNGMVTRIQGKQITEEELLKALEKTSHQAQRAGQIIQRIRSFIRRSESNRVLTLIAPMVSEVVELAELEMRRRQVRLSLYVSDRISKILVDPILIEQVLINLLKNAAEAIGHAKRPIDDRHVELQIVPKIIEGQQVVAFSVTDNGNGMTDEVMHRVFEAFYTTKKEGMGIGLNLCRSIVESHQGRMQAENIYNGNTIVGCRFSFWLPANPVMVNI
ncbi:MAG: multi-sensor signal transduction histidine kinase BphP [Pseudomonadota bacterium]|jgi:PAS domain S-box-containing protein